MASLDTGVVDDPSTPNQSRTPPVLRAEILIIGNEILSGKVPDEHAAFLCVEFRALGVDVRRVVVLPDDVDAIADAVRIAWDRADVIITTGGVGPTHDDVTLAGIAQGLKRPLVRHPVLEGLVREVYGVADNPYVNRLADLPEGAELLTAEGMRVPVIAVDKVFIFPGVPDILRRKFHAIKDRFRGEPFHLRTIYLLLGEEPISALLFEITREFPSLVLGSYPVIDRPGYRTKLTLESKDPAYLDSAFSFVMARLPADAVVGIDREPTR